MNRCKLTHLEVAADCCCTSASSSICPALDLTGGGGAVWQAKMMMIMMTPGARDIYCHNGHGRHIARAIPSVVYVTAVDRNDRPLTSFSLGLCLFHLTCPRGKKVSYEHRKWAPIMKFTFALHFDRKAIKIRAADLRVLVLCSEGPE